MICTCPVHGSSVFTPEEFRKKYRVGDVITSWSTDKPAKITAIGESRILYVDHRNRESVCSMRRAWRDLEIIRPTPTESQDRGE